MAEVIKGMLRDDALEKITVSEDKPRGIFRTVGGGKCYVNSDGTRYKMLSDGSWVFDGKKN